LKDHLYYLVDPSLAIPLKNAFKVQTKFVETTNFVPSLVSNHSSESGSMNTDAIISQGETWMTDLDFLMENDSVNRLKSPFSPSESFLRFMDDKDDNEEDDDWDEDEEDWDEDEDEEDDDWDEDEEEWDEDEDWDEDEEDDDNDDWDEDSDED
jgi:hypothetical protein